MAPEPIDLLMYNATSRGGHPRYVKELLSAIALESRGEFCVSLITTSDLGNAYRGSLYQTYDILPPASGWERPTNPAKRAFLTFMETSKRESLFLDFVIEKRPCDAVHFQNYTPWFAPAHFRKLKSMGIRLLFTVHNVFPHSYPFAIPKPVFDRWTRSAWRECDALFVHSESSAADLSAHLGPNHPSIFVVPHGVWSEGSPTHAAGFEERLSRRRLLFFGAIRKNKGLHVLLEAMDGLPEFSLIAAGEPAEPKYLRRIREQMTCQAADQVTLIDRFIEEEEIPGLFAESSLVVLPYTSFYGQSGVLHLALTYGIPTVCSDIGALGETVRTWGVGRVVPPNDVPSLAKAIRELHTRQVYREVVGAIERARKGLSWKRAARVTIEAYRSVIKGIGSGGSVNPEHQSTLEQNG